MKTTVVIPTYNEKENIALLIKKILALKIKNLHILVVDDNSPDRTAEIVKKIAKKRKNVHLLLRKKNKGRGFAGRAGFVQALKSNSDIIIEMDADFSHDPKYIPKLISELKSADVVLGSRQVQGGKEKGRHPLRRFITWGANAYIRLLLGITVKDCNSGFRCFKKKALQSIDVQNLTSSGPSIVQEVLFKVHLKGFKIKEIPITFVDREKGNSKLGLGALANGYWMVLKLKMLRVGGKL